MELDWSTFIFEIINFLVLIWILTHFFYRPVLAVIERRRTTIDKKLSDAESLHAEGKQLKAQYEERLSDWKKERQRAREILQIEVDEEHSHMMADLSAALEQERQKARVGEEHRLQEQLNRMEEQALQNGMQFVTRLLQQTASSDLEARLIDILLKGFERLPAERIESLRRSWGAGPIKASLVSAYPLIASQQQQLTLAINEITGMETVIEFGQDCSLLAGLRITIDGWVLGLNLRDELHGFSVLELEMASGA